MTVLTTACPGCGLELPAGTQPYDRKFNASAECWSVFEEVLAKEFQSAPLFGQVHQLTVDAFAVQHAGGRHPDKSVCIHLVGLHLVMERGVRPADVPQRLQRLAGRKDWPHLEPPAERAALTVHDVALAGSPEVHVERAKAWAAEVWRVWAPHHAAARDLAEET